MSQRDRESQQHCHNATGWALPSRAGEAFSPFTFSYRTPGLERHPGGAMGWALPSRAGEAFSPFAFFSSTPGLETQIGGAMGWALPSRAGEKVFLLSLSFPGLQD